MSDVVQPWKLPSTAWPITIAIASVAPAYDSAAATFSPMISSSSS
jgi:hypothetical protein